MNAAIICRRICNSRLVRGTKKVLRDHGADIFSVLAAGFVVATGITAYNAGNNEVSFSDDERKRKVHNLLIPVSCGTASIACIAGARYCGKLREESLLAACSALALYTQRANGQGDNKEDFRTNVCTNSDIEDTGTGEIVFEETFTGRKFLASMDVVEYALRKLQENFSICGFASLNDLYGLIGIKETAAGESLAWTSDQMVLDPDYIPGDFFEYREALTTLAIQLQQVSENEYVLHYNILPIGSLAGIGPCNH